MRAGSDLRPAMSSRRQEPPGRPLPPPARAGLLPGAIPLARGIGRISEELSASAAALPSLDSGRERSARAAGPATGMPEAKSWARRRNAHAELDSRLLEYLAHRFLPVPMVEDPARRGSPIGWLRVRFVAEDLGRPVRAVLNSLGRSRRKGYLEVDFSFSRTHRLGPQALVRLSLLGVTEARRRWPEIHLSLPAQKPLRLAFAFDERFPSGISVSAIECPRAPNLARALRRSTARLRLFLLFYALRSRGIVASSQQLLQALARFARSDATSQRSRRPSVAASERSLQRALAFFRTGRIVSRVPSAGRERRWKLADAFGSVQFRGPAGALLSPRLVLTALREFLEPLESPARSSSSAGSLLEPCRRGLLAG
jgi:hypothetical protein